MPPPYLAGRDRLLADADDWLIEAHPLHANWALTGLRGTGKTVLLGEIAARAERAGWLTLERELGDRHRSEEQLAAAISDDCDALRARADAWTGIGQTLARGARYLRPSRVTVGEIGVEPAYDAGTAVPTEAMTSALEQLRDELATTDRRGALLLYDEAHLLADDRARDRFPLSSLLAALGHVQRAGPTVRIILCGLPTLSLNLKRARTYAERMFRHVVVGNLELDAASEAIAIPLAHAGRSFSLGLIGHIVEETGGYPYFLQFFAAFACSRIGLPHIERVDFERVEGALLHELDLAFFEDRFLAASPAEQELLLAMGALGSHISLRQLRARSVRGGNVDELLRRLVDRGLLYRPTRGSYEFALPLFAAYLRRSRKLTQLTPGVSSASAADR